MKPRIFIGSSGESLDIAHSVQEALEPVADTIVWDQGVFQPSMTTLEAIFQALDSSDFGIFILGADDVTTLRGSQVKTARDNVLFELGIFAGRIGIGKTFFMVPDGVEGFHLPTDLLGITHLKFRANRDNLMASLGPTCTRIKRALRARAVLPKPAGASSPVTVITAVDEGSRFAATRIGLANHVRIVGTARQEVVNETSAAAEYLVATENRAKSEKPFSYLRITSSTLSSSFRQHLSSMLRLSRHKEGKRIEVAVDGQMNASISYMIFDGKELLLIVDNTVFGSVRDNRIMIWSCDRDIVKAFSDHFDHAWGRIPKKCTTAAQLNKETSTK